MVDDGEGLRAEAQLEAGIRSGEEGCGERTTRRYLGPRGGSPRKLPSVSPGGQWATVNQADAGDHYVRVDPNGQLGSSRGDRTTDRGGRRSALGHALCEGEAVAGPRAGPAWHQP